MPDELRLHIRDEPAPDDATVVVRGGPDNLTKLAGTLCVPAVRTSSTASRFSG